MVDSASIATIVNEAAPQRRLDPDLAALSLLNLCAFPFLAAPVASRAIDYAADPEHIERLAAHTTTLFFRGTEAAS